MTRGPRWIESRLNISPIFAAVKSSQPEGRIPLREAPPYSTGRIALLLIAVLVASGFGLLLFYEPSADAAAASLARLHSSRPLGWLIHNAHRWSALLLVLVVVLHGLRVFLARAYRLPRDLNWWIGLGLAAVILAMVATGYMLRWDIKAFALLDLVVASFSEVPIVGRALIQMMLGGAGLDRVPLYRGYAFHVWVIPLLLGTVLAFHLATAWRQGLADRPGRWQRWRHRIPQKRLMSLLPAIALLALVLLLALTTPHEGQAGPVDRSRWPHPDWLLGLYFLPIRSFGAPLSALGAVSALFGFLILVPRIASETARRSHLAALTVLVLVTAVWSVVQASSIGYRMPSQGCTACHRRGILGGAPTSLSDFKIRRAEWLLFHLQEPELSILAPAPPAEPLP